MYVELKTPQVQQKLWKTTNVRKEMLLIIYYPHKFILPVKTEMLYIIWRWNLPELYYSPVKNVYLCEFFDNIPLHVLTCTHQVEGRNEKGSHLYRRMRTYSYISYWIRNMVLPCWFTFTLFENGTTDWFTRQTFFSYLKFWKVKRTFSLSDYTSVVPKAQSDLMSQENRFWRW